MRCERGVEEARTLPERAVGNLIHRIVLRHVDGLADATRQIHQSRDDGTAIQRLVRAVELRVRLLEQRHPQLVRVVAVREDALVVLVARQERVDVDLLPLELVEAEADEALLDALRRRVAAVVLVDDDRVQQVLCRDRRHRAEQVAIAELALDHITRVGAVLDERELVDVGALDLVRPQPADVAVRVRLARGRRAAVHIDAAIVVRGKGLVGPQFSRRHTLALVHNLPVGNVILPGADFFGVAAEDHFFSAAAVR